MTTLIETLPNIDLVTSEANVTRRSVAVITNPNAGKNTPRAGLGRVIASILSTPHWIYTPDTLAELGEVAQQLGRERPDILVIVGGDGTIHQTLSKVLREHDNTPSTPLPQVLIIPVGTMNNVATAIGLTRHPAVKLAKLIAAKIRENRPLDVMHRNPLKINDEYGFLYGTGLPVNFLQRCYENRGQSGSTRAVKVILSTLGNELISVLTFKPPHQILTRPVHATITFPKEHEPPVVPFTTHTGIMCASVDNLGLGCRGMPEATSQPGCFMLRSTQLGFWGLAATLGPLWAGLPLPATFDAVVSHVQIDYQEPTIATIDGDMTAPTTCDIIDCGPTVSFITG